MGLLAGRNITIVHLHHLGESGGDSHHIYHHWWKYNNSSSSSFGLAVAQCLFHFNVDFGNAQKVFVKISVRNFEMMLRSLMIKKVGVLSIFVVLVCEIYSPNNVTSFVY